jgi:HK97 gp10 family phage protein
MGIEVTFVSNLDSVMKQIDETVKARMNEAVNTVRNHAVETLSGSRSGKTYRVPGTKVTYTASAPGEPPAVQTGELRQSISTEIEGEGRDIVGMVGTDKKQGLMTEFGTRNMAPRPWLRPSFERKEPDVKEIFLRTWF